MVFEIFKHKYVIEHIGKKQESLIQLLEPTRSLLLPQPELNFIFIPKRILQIALDPTEIRAAVMKNAPEQLRFFIVEKRRSPVTDPKRLEQWLNTTGGSSQVIPDGIDYLHAQNLHYIDQGYLTLFDYIYFQFSLSRSRFDQQILYVDWINTRKEYEKKHIGREFLKRAEVIFRKMGFKYIMGSILEESRNFFNYQGWLALESFPHDEALSLYKTGQSEDPGGYYRAKMLQR